MTGGRALLGATAWLALTAAGLPAQVATPLGASLAEATVAHAAIWGAGANPAAGPPLGRSAPPTHRLAVQAYGLSLASPATLTRAGVDLAWAPAAAGGTGFQLGVQYFDPPGFGVTALRLGVRRRLGERVFGGLRVGGLIGDYEAYGREASPVAEGGLLYEVTPTLRAGAHYSYVSRELLPLAQRRLRIGVDYASSRQVRLLVAASQAVGEPLNGQFGVLYRPAERVRLALGYQTLGQRLSFGSEVAAGGGIRLGLAVVVFSRLPMGLAYGVSAGEAGGW